MTKTRMYAFGGVIAMMLSSASAQAALIEGTGLFGAGTPRTAFSRAGRSFQFSFDLPASFARNVDGTASTGAISNFTYTLNGSLVDLLPTTITFFDPSGFGLFDLAFANGSSLSFFGQDIGSDGSLPATSSYVFSVGVNAGSPGQATGNGFLTVTNSVVPEPASWAMMIGGFGLVGAAMRRRGNVRTTVGFA